MPRSLVTYYELIAPEYTQEDIDFFKSRWDGELKPFRDDIVQAIENNDEKLLDSVILKIPTINYIYHNQDVKLVDLRGIDLSNLSFSKMDLAYCCFDFSNLNHCFFDKTHFQYSSFQHARLKNTTWIHVQGSPTSLIESDLSDSIIKDSFFMQSDFYRAHTDNLMLPGSGVEGTRLNMYDSKSRKLKL